MDILDHIADYIRAELGDDIFTEARRDDFLVQFRLQYGKDRHYVYSLAAKAETDRVRAIFSGLRAGLSSREIAARVGITQRRVNQILATVPMPGNPLP
jgi:hypothetical protein